MKKLSNLISFFKILKPQNNTNRKCCWGTINYCLESIGKLIIRKECEYIMIILNIDH